MFLTVLVVLFALTFLVVVLGAAASNNGSRIGRKTDYLLEFTRGQLNHKMVCPHCAQAGNVRTKHLKQKQGLHGGKATAAVLTGGVSLLATGLSRKHKITEAFCESCNNTWQF